MDKREISLKLEGDELVPDPLGMSTTLEDFQYEGTFALTIDRLKILARTGAMLFATPFNIFAEMPSGPFDLDVSSCCKRSRTSSSVHNSSSGQGTGMVGSGTYS